APSASCSAVMSENPTTSFGSARTASMSRPSTMRCTPYPPRVQTTARTAGSRRAALSDASRCASVPAKKLCRPYTSAPSTTVSPQPDSSPARRLGGWVTEGGLALEVCRPHAGDPLPEQLDGYAALVVLGGEQPAYPAPDGTPGAPWFPALEGLLRKAVRYEVATLGVCLGGQLLAAALGGTVERSAAGPEIGPRLVARRDAAERDALWAPVPLAPDVLQSHLDEITELPAR